MYYSGYVKTFIVLLLIIVFLLVWSFYKWANHSRKK